MANATAIDSQAPITWLVNLITDQVSAAAIGVASNVSTLIAPLVSVGFGIYVLLITLNYLRGAESQPVMDFIVRMISFSIVITFGFGAGNYATYISPIVTGLGGDLAMAFTGGTVDAGSLDQLALYYFNILDKNLELASSSGFPANIPSLILYLIQAALILLGLVPFLVAATIAIIVANCGSIMVGMVGPIYFGFLLFPATRQYFSAWLNTALSYALIPVFIAVISVMSVGLSKAMLSSDGVTLSDMSLKGAFFASIGNLILVFLIKQVSSLASALSAGGINASMPAGLGAAASGIYSSGKAQFREAKGAYQAGKSGYQLGKTAYQIYQNRGNSIRKAG